MVALEKLTAGANVRGLSPNTVARIITVEWFGDQALKVTFEDGKGRVAQQLIYRADEPRLEIVQSGRPWSFDGDGHALRLVSEAYRIRLAHLFDPYLAIHTSRITPLPHQITAVYGEMLPRQPLRFLLADDPGAGKTIMAGLLIKELAIRGDLDRCLIVAPGSLVEQWQDELAQKFGLAFDILTRDQMEASRTGNPFAERAHLIARLDMMSRSEDMQRLFKAANEWDLVVCDEAHRMAASFFGGEVKYTKRYQLGQLLGSHCRHLLMMSATPHNGREEDFQLFMALLDADRFEGKFRDGVHKSDASDMMRRLTKEELLQFDGRPLFPERKAYTAQFELSDAEAALYSNVTTYVREEMNRAERFGDDDQKRRNNVGFALQILQRRLASSPAAIHESLKRRKERLEARLAETKLLSRGAEIISGPTAPLQLKLLVSVTRWNAPKLAELQPHYIESFFRQAFSHLGGQMHPRENGRFEITRVPGAIRERDRAIGRSEPVLERYERVCFEKKLISGPPVAAFLCPGHPLLDATIDLVLERYRDLLKCGAVLVNEADDGNDIRALFYLQHAVQDGRQTRGGEQQVISERLQFVEVDAKGQVRDGGPAPYLDYRPITADEKPLVSDELNGGWLSRNLEEEVMAYAITSLAAEHVEEVRNRRLREIAKVENEVAARLKKEINYWDHRAEDLKAQERAGKAGGRLNAAQAANRANELADRLQRRLAELSREWDISARPPAVKGGALVVPGGLLRRLASPTSTQPSQFSDDTASRAEIERLAMQAVIDAEKALGHVPRDVSAERIGYDIESRNVATGHLRFIEVKGRIEGADTVTITRNEILTALNKPEAFVLAIVSVAEGFAHKPLYVRTPFKREPDFGATSVTYHIAELLRTSKAPS